MFCLKKSCFKIFLRVSENIPIQKMYIYSKYVRNFHKMCKFLENILSESVHVTLNILFTKVDFFT